MGPRAATLVLVVVTALLAATPAAGAATFTVNDPGNAGDLNTADATCDSDPVAGVQCTLRAAIQQVDAQSSGAPHDVQFSISAITVANPLPAITRDGTFFDACEVGRSQLGTPNAPTSPDCVHLSGSANGPDGLVVQSADDVQIQGFRFTGFSDAAVELWGSSNSQVAGNRFGLLTDGADAGNGTGVSVSARVVANVTEPAQGNVIGGASDAASDPAFCAGFCNIFGWSDGPAIDLADQSPGHAPPGGETATEGTTIAGNWIGVRTVQGAAVPNAVAIALGNSEETTVGGDDSGSGNVISGNTTGVDQGTGTTSSTLLYGVYGLSPDQDTTVGNGPFHARLRGSMGGRAHVWNATFGPAPVGLQLEGPGAEVIGASFRAPTPQSPDRFTTAAIRLGPDANSSWIGSTNQLAAPLPANGCIVLIFPLDGCTAIGAVGAGAYGILVQGADGLTIRRTGIGGSMSGGGPIEGVPVRFENGAGDDPVQGALVGIEADQGWNDFQRISGPAVQVDGGSTGVTIAGNGGLASTSFDAVASRFTDLLPPAGLGNATANGGVQPPVVTQATIEGVAGTATPNAVIRVIQQQRPVDAETVPSDPPEGYTYPATETFATANGAGAWGITFPDNAVLAGQKLFASQTVNGSTSEFAAPADVQQTAPDPLVTFTEGPTGLVTATSATFAFASDTAGSEFLCSLDGGAFAACTSPHTVGPLEPGGHQFQVKAKDQLGTVGPPASRNWIIELPGQTTAPGTKTPLGTSAGSGGAGGVNPSSASVALSSVVTFPSAKKCVSRRALKIRLKKPKGTGIAFVKIDVPGRATKTVRGKAISAPVNLRGLPKGRFTVRLRITLLDGRVVKGSRTFRTCAPKRR